MALLLYLAARAGRVVPAEELLAEVWKGVVVTPSSLYQSIALLRHALGDDSDEPRYVANIPRKGYRLIAAVKQDAGRVAPAASTDASSANVESNRSGTFWRIVAASVLVLAGIAWLLAPESIRNRVIGSSPPARSVAVLPFQNLGPDPTEDYLADGLTEDLLQSLGRLPGVTVTARSSVFVFRERSQDVRDIARTLGVRYVLDGSVRRVDEHIRINVQLVDAASGLDLWSESYDRPFTDVLRVQEDIARSVANSLEILLTRDASERIARRAQHDSAVFDAYLQGRAYWNERGADSLRRAQERFQWAIDRDPDHAASHVALAELHAVLPLYGVEPPDIAFPAARAAALRALEIDNGLAEARATLAVIRYQYEWDAPGAEEEFRRSLALNPSYATARQWYSEFLSYNGRSDEAETQIALASALDPLSPVIATLHGSPALWARRYEDAERGYRKAIAAHPAFALAHYSLGLAQMGQKQPEEAAASFQRASAGLGADFIAPSLAHAYVQMSRTSEARRLLDVLLASERTHYVSPYKLAVLHVALGELEPALERLAEAVRIHDDRLVLMGVDPFLDALRSDPRFKSLRQSMSKSGGG